MRYTNPILEGFYPDPSVCRVDDHYYMVCSSFQYFPGVPLFESTDLINWTQIGHVLTRDSQLPLKDADSHGGIYAPTIRYDQGCFYMITTNCSDKGNFLVWTEDIYGGWSEPVWLAQDGIDPSLYFEDGRCYFMRNHSDGENACILQCEINPKTGERLSEEKAIWYGNGGRYLEAPHLYKIHGSYYMMAAEGGTEYGHMEIYAKGDHPYGPFENAPNNPVLTNRNIGDYQLQGVGHGDLVEDVHGNYWMVHLAFRQIARWCTYHHIGRETCLVPVTFDENGWFTAGDAQGISRLAVETDRLAPVEQCYKSEITFANTMPEREWCYLRNPKRDHYDLTRWNDGCIKLRAAEDSINGRGANSFYGIRQTSLAGEISVKVDLGDGIGGLSIYMDQENHYDLRLCRENQGLHAQLRKRIADIDYVEKDILLSADDVTVELKVIAEPQQYTFQVVTQGQTYPLGTGVTRLLSSEVAGGFAGVMLGLYADEGEDWVTFSDFHYRREELPSW